MLWWFATPRRGWFVIPTAGRCCSVDYQALLRKGGILIYMSGRGNCYDNSMVETLFKTIKSELIWPVAWQTRDQAEDAVARYIDGSYNPQTALIARFPKPHRLQANGPGRELNALDKSRASPEPAPRSGTASPK